MIGASVLRDLDIDSLVEALPTYTTVGKIAIQARLSEPLTDETELARRQAEIRAIRSRSKKEKAGITQIREKLQQAEADVVSIATANTDERHAEYYSQILWSPSSKFAWLNTYSWLNEAIVFFRTLFLPGLSVLLPLCVFAAPLIFYNLVLKEPLTVKSYIQLLQTSLKKAMPSVLGKPRFEGTGGVLEFGEQFVHIGISLAMFIASIWNQISAAISMRAVVADMRRRADALKTFASATTDLAAALGLSSVTGFQALDKEQLALFGHAWNSPEQIHALLDYAGQLDMLAAIALTKRSCFPKLSRDHALEIKDLYHPGLDKKACIYNSVSMSADKRKHILLTGPNRGGKSTFLKSLGSAVLMAQTIGIVFGRSARLPIFDNIITALSPQDVVGKLSLFEAEIEFAKEVNQRLAEGGSTFLMMDEIFHGTNAHDGVEASQVFLDSLYKTPSVLFSVVSTHYMDLPKRYGAELTQNLCMDASVDPEDPDRLLYTYKLKEGVNCFSSVREILRERGLLR